MPPKTCICAICRKTVLKSRTLHIGNGQRACREHPGVATKAAGLKDAETFRLHIDTLQQRHWDTITNQAAGGRYRTKEDTAVE